MVLRNAEPFKRSRSRDIVIVRLPVPSTAAHPQLDMSCNAAHRNNADAVAKPDILPNVEQQYTRPIAVAAIVCRVYPETPNLSTGW